MLRLVLDPVPCLCRQLEQQIRVFLGSTGNDGPLSELELYGGLLAGVRQGRGWQSSCPRACRALLIIFPSSCSHVRDCRGHAIP